MQFIPVAPLNYAHVVRDPVRCHDTGLMAACTTHLTGAVPDELRLRGSPLKNHRSQSAKLGAFTLNIPQHFEIEAVWTIYSQLARRVQPPPRGPGRAGVGFWGF